MDLDLLGSVGWREGLIVIIVLLVSYIIVLYLRMQRLQRGVAALPPLAAQAATAAYTAIQEAAPVAVAVAPGTAAVPDGEPVASVAAPDTPGPGFAWNEPPPEIPGQALIDALQREFYQLRCEVDELRAEVLAAREDFRQHAVQGSAPAASPLYNDAMQMALQGHDATTIAHHCDIARAEADLVVALARNRHPGV